MKQALSPETPARVRRGQFRAITLGIGASALAMACSFGEIDAEKNDGFADVAAPSSDPVVKPGTTNQTPSAADPSTPSNSGGAVSKPNTAAMGPDGFNPDENPFESQIGQEVKAILQENCAGCHQSPSKSGDMDFILDPKALVDNKKIIPGNKEDSQLYVRMIQQSMPPAFERERRPSFSQIDLVGRFIDELPPLDSESCAANPFANNDDLIAAMAADIARLDEEDAVFTRYLTVAYNNNAGGCGRELQRQRYALFKTINSLSTNPVVRKLEAIDKAELIYRVDLRDFNWDRDIDLEDDGVVDFADAWLAIVDGVNALGGEFAPEYAGNEADALKLDAGTAVPFMPVNAFIQAAEQGDLYYTLIGAKANLFDFERDVLKIDTQAEIDDNNLMRAGFTNSGVSKQDRVLNRFDSGLGAGQSYWISFDFDGGNGNGELNVSNESIFADPLGFKFAGGEAIFSLPNGLQGYYVAKADGGRLAEAPIGVVVDPAQNNGLVVNGASCNSCHNAGMISFSDQVRSYVQTNKIEFDNQTYEDVMLDYPDAQTFQRQMDADSKMHTDASIRAGIPAGTPDAVSRVFLDFQVGNITARYAAGEFGVTEQELLQNLDLLDPQLQPLAEKGGYVDRDILGANFLDSICILQASNENQPVGCP